MKKYSLFVLFCLPWLLSSSLFAYDESILKASKLNSLASSQKIIGKSYSNSLYSLLAKPAIVYQMDTTNAGDNTVSKDTLSLRLEQDIFKSGGHFYALQKASLQEKLDLSKLAQQKRSLVFGAYQIIVGLKKLDLSLEKQKLLLENKKINVKTLQDKYNQGLVGSLVLESALIERNTLENALFSLQTTKDDLLFSLKKLSDKDYSKIALWDLKPVEQATFLASNYAIQIAKLDYDYKNSFAKSTTTGFLPKVTAYYNYNSDLTNEQTSDSYGVRATFVLNTNALPAIQIAKIASVQTLDALQDTKADEANFYAQVQSDLRNTQERIANMQKNISFYDTLVKSTTEQYKQKLRTKNDVTVIQNTKKSAQKDLEVFKLDKHLKLAKLYEKASL